MPNLKYTPDLCTKAEEFLAQGFSQEAFAGHIGIARSTLYLWKAKHKELGKAIDRGVAKSQLFWERVGLSGTLGLPLTVKDANGVERAMNQSQFNSATWIFNMKNRFNWRDKTDVTSDDEKLNAGYVVLPPLKDDQPTESTMEGDESPVETPSGAADRSTK